MTCRSASIRGLSFTLACLLLGGCVPPPGVGDQTQGERYFNAGKARIQQLDFPGAIAAFERALQADPQQANAHYEQAMLYDRELNSPEKALYHYLRVLELNPEFEGSDLISNRLSVVRMQLARGSVPTIPSPLLAADIDRLQQELDMLQAEHQQLLAENTGLKQQVALLSRQPIATNPPARLNPLPAETPPPTGTRVPPAGVTRETAPVTRMHTIQKGDTLYGLSKRYQVSLAELQAANPGLSDRNFPVGRNLKIPVK
jgi:tetratricopeptide (TPR) repeat protein